MKITYIGHSGFLLEWNDCYFLFDYYKGEIPIMDPKKKIIVFVSHKHGDHYNEDIFQLFHKYSQVEYVLSSDINWRKTNFHQYGNPSELMDSILSVKPDNEYEIFIQDNKSIHLKTLKSTDCGVAFLLKYQGKTIYHAGDLNLWVWKEETMQYNNNMTAKFMKEMKLLKDISIDIAFVPLDPRQEEYYNLGMETLLDTAKVKYVFPMHLWDKYEIIKQFKTEWLNAKDDTKIIEIDRVGQNFLLDDIIEAES